MREPGTGTQYCTFASPPDRDEEPNSMTINGTKWKCGHQYFDTELRDNVVLSYIIGKSSWCENSPPEDSPPILVFEYERAMDGGTTRRDPMSRSFDADRFIERCDPAIPMGAPELPW